MDASEAERLLSAAVPAELGAWADFGAGDGTFTRALAARLGPGAKVYAVDRDIGALQSLRRGARDGDADITIVRADLERAFELPGAEHGMLDGALLANTLHFMRNPAGVLARLLRPGASLVVIEYDRRPPSRWVPHPIDSAKLPELFEAAGFAAPHVVARADSAYGGEMYVAVGRKR